MVLAMYLYFPSSQPTYRLIAPLIPSADVVAGKVLSGRAFRFMRWAFWQRF